MYEERLLPHDIEAEESVIGSLLIDGNSILRVAHFLKPTDFYREKNRFCYEACLALFQRGEAINQVTVANRLTLEDRAEAGRGHRVSEPSGIHGTHAYSHRRLWPYCHSLSSHA